MNNKKFFFVLTLCCISMFVLGAGVGHVYTKHMMFKEMKSKFRKDFRKSYTAHYKERLSRELHLTTDQEKQLDIILSRYEVEIKTKQKAARDDFRQTMKKMNDDVMSILNEEQKVTFTKLSKFHGKGRFSHPRNERFGDR